MLDRFSQSVLYLYHKANLRNRAESSATHLASKHERDGAIRTGHFAVAQHRRETVQLLDACLSSSASLACNEESVPAPSYRSSTVRPSPFLTSDLTAVSHRVDVYTKASLEPCRVRESACMREVQLSGFLVKSSPSHKTPDKHLFPNRERGCSTSPDTLRGRKKAKAVTSEIEEQQMNILGEHSLTWRRRSNNGETSCTFTRRREKGQGEGELENWPIR
ncbi:hypothetical protein PO909_030416 [Leuciscus waleckii]